MKNDKKLNNFKEIDQQELRFENELLKLQMRAEFGACHHHSVNEIPPEIENFFLKNVMNIERAYATRNTIKLYDKLGRPPFLAAEDLDDDAIEKAQLALEEMLRENRIFVSFPDYDTPREKYVFITQQLFNTKIDNLDVPDLAIHFDYLDFREDDDDEDEDHAFEEF